MEKNISQIILNKIKGENIKPKARWYFVMKHAVLWMPGIIVTTLGAISVAGVLYAIEHTGSEYYEFVYPTKVSFILAAIPYMWVVSFIFFSSMTVQALRTTHEGYRFSAKNLLLGSLALSFTIGALLFFIDNRFNADSIIRYPIHEREQKIWSLPSEGRLSGFIEKEDDKSLTLRDKDNTVWNVDISGFSSDTLPPFVKEGNNVRIIGTSTDSYIFTACVVLPWDIGEFHRPAFLPSAPLHKPFMMHDKNKSLNCKVVLESMKMRILGR